MKKKFMKRIPIEVWVILILSAGTLIFYQKFNKNKDVERYLHDHIRVKYYVFITAYYIVFVAFVLNLRFLLYEIYVS